MSVEIAWKQNILVTFAVFAGSQLAIALFIYKVCGFIVGKKRPVS
jgi:hypothetical protein